MKNNKGITLIALVVTIIVLLILAGVSIAMLTGQNGILTNAQEAKNSSTAGALDEAAKIAIGNIMTDKLGWPYSKEVTNTTTNTTTTELDETTAGTDGATLKALIISEIKKVNSNIDIDATDSSKVSINNNVLSITADVDGKEQTVKINLLTGAVSK